MKCKTLWVALVLATTAFSVQAASETQKSSGGYFIAKNATNKTVTIRVGNFFPTSYTIEPHGSKTVVVSSDNQNIEISEIS